MAKATGSTSGIYKGSKHVKRKGIHAKTKHSSNKQSKNYVKPYKGQGR